MCFAAQHEDAAASWEHLGLKLRSRGQMKYCQTVLRRDSVCREHCGKLVCLAVLRKSNLSSTVGREAKLSQHHV